MQGKVSIVVTCYNKASYIGGMLDSIIAQEWDNIELILVNDGSTDGTREVIDEYEPKLFARGFEAVIINQENAGVCSAAKAGLERITGDYVCMVDADDELDSRYVSTMAGWLDEHEEYDLTACDGVQYTGSGTDKLFSHFSPREISSSDPFVVEKYILTTISSTVWIYMVRVEYLRKCCILETYFTDTKGSHEPGYIIPLLSYKGNLRYFPTPLYHFNVSVEDAHSQVKRFEQAQRYYDAYDKLCNIAIDALPDSIADEAKKTALKEISLISKYIHLYRCARKVIDGDGPLEDVFAKLLELINKIKGVNPPITREMVIGSEEIFIKAVECAFTGYQHKKTNIPDGRVIGYGALGRAARRILPHLAGTQLEPDELWDIKGDGEKIKKPAFDKLRSNDLVLVFPVGVVEDELKERLVDTPFKIIYNSDLWNFISHEYFGIFMGTNLT